MAPSLNRAGCNESSLKNDSQWPSSAPFSSSSSFSSSSFSSSSFSSSSYYDIVLHMRPDLAYDRLDVAEMRAFAKTASGDRVFVGDFDHTWSGVHNRLALGHNSNF